MTAKKRKLTAAVTALLALVLAACSGGSGSGFPDNYDYDDLAQFIKLADYKGIGYTKAEAVTDEDVAAQIEQTLDQSTEEVKIESGTVAEDSVVNIDYSGSIDGEKFDGGTAQGAELDIANNSYIKGFADGIVGHKVGETFDINVTFPEDYGKEALNGRDAVFTITVNYMIESRKPEYTDEWVRENTGYDDKASYEAAVRKQLEEERAVSAESNARSEVFTKISEASEVIEYPEKELKERHDKTVRQYESIAQNAGYDLDDYLASQGMDTETFNSYVDQAAEKVVKTELILHQIAREEGIEFTDSGYEDFLKKMLESSGYTEESFKKEYGMDISQYAQENDLYITYMYDTVMTKVMEYSKAV